MVRVRGGLTTSDPGLVFVNVHGMKLLLESITCALVHCGVCSIVWGQFVRMCLYIFLFFSKNSLNGTKCTYMVAHHLNKYRMQVSYSTRLLFRWRGGLLAIRHRSTVHGRVSYGVDPLPTITNSFPNVLSASCGLRKPTSGVSMSPDDGSLRV